MSKIHDTNTIQRTMRDGDGWVVDIRQNQGELYTSVPILGGFVLPSVLQVKRRMLDMITVREEENAPMRVNTGAKS